MLHAHLDYATCSEVDLYKVMLTDMSGWLAVCVLAPNLP